MIYIVIGQSGAGKTSFCKSRWVKEPCVVYEDIIYCTKCPNNVVALGKYFVGIRTEGTDTLSYSAKDKIKAQLKKLTDEGYDILMEGDRINNKEILTYAASLQPVEMYLIICPLKESMRRLRAAGRTSFSDFLRPRMEDGVRALAHGDAPT